MSTIKVFVRGKKEVQLSDERDYVADGGEGRIYAKKGVVYKLYLDPNRMIPEAKIAELAALDHPNIVRPKDLLLNEKQQIIGFTMDQVKGTELCRLFNTVFLTSNSITPEMLLKLVEAMQTITQFIHDRQCLIVDGNELNYLVDESSYIIPFFIDVNSYQTPGFPASAINIFFQDPHASAFSTLTDWYSFGIVACKIFVGVHPYKGHHPAYGKKDVLQRMQDNVSIFNPDTQLPVAARDFSYIPGAYREWFVKLFEKGERLPPPSAAGLLKVVPVRIELVQSTGNFTIKLLRTYDAPILGHTAVAGLHVVTTKNTMYIGGNRYARTALDGPIVFTPKSLTPLVARVRTADNMLEITDLQGNPLALTLKVSRPAFIAGQTLYAINQGDLTEITFHELNSKPVAAVANVWKIMPQSSTVYDGFIFQTVLGKAYVVIPYHRGGRSSCAIKAIPELDPYRIVNGKHDNRVCMLIGFKDQTYDRIILRFDEQYERYDVRVIEDIDYPSLNFIALDNGVVVSLDEHAAVEIFLNVPGSTKLKRIEDPAMQADMRLSKDGATALVYSGPKLYTLRMT